MRTVSVFAVLLAGCTETPVDFGESLPGWAHPDDAVATVAGTLVPFDANLGDLRGPASTTYGKTPEIVVVPDGTDLYILANNYDQSDSNFQAPLGAKLLKLERTIDDYIITQVIDPPNFLDRILGFDRGEDGSLYVASAAVEFDEVNASYPALDEYRSGVVHVTRLSPQGDEELFVDLDLARAAAAENPEQVINPMTAATGRLAVGGGFIALVHGINTTPDPAIGNRRHQKALTTIIDDSTGNVRQASTIWVSHSFDQRLFWDGEAFVEHHLGDAYPRHIAFARTYPTGGGSGEYPLLFIKGATGENTTRTTIGDVVALPDDDAAAFLAVYATEPTETLDPINNGFANIAGSREIAVTRVMRGFEQMDWREQAHLDEGLPDRLLALGQETPLRWLTDYHSQSPGVLHADRPKMIDAGDGRYIVLWERWTLDNQQTYAGTWGTVIDAQGQTLVEAREITRNHLSRGDDMFVLENQAAWVTGHFAAHALTVHMVDAELNYSEFVVE